MTITDPRTLEEMKAFAFGKWESLAVELRPTDRSGSGTIQPTFLRRNFTYNADDALTGIITMCADNYRKAGLMEFEFKAHLIWGNADPIAKGAYSIDYVLDEVFGVTALHEDAAGVLNGALPEGMPRFSGAVKQDILGNAFPLFQVGEGQIVNDYDLTYFNHGRSACRWHPV